MQTMHSSLRLLLPGLLVLAGFVLGVDVMGAWSYGPWSEDVAAAKREAHENNRPLVVYMGNLQYCGYCREAWRSATCDGGPDHTDYPCYPAEDTIGFYGVHPLTRYVPEKQVVFLKVVTHDENGTVNPLAIELVTNYGIGLFPAYFIFHVKESADLDDGGRMALDPDQVDYIGGFVYRKGETVNGIATTVNNQLVFDRFRQIMESFFPNGYWESVDVNQAPSIQGEDLDIPALEETVLTLLVEDGNNAPGDLQLSWETQPTKGTADLRPGDVLQLAYTPGDDLRKFGGSDAFSIRVTDPSGASAVGDYTVTVPENSPPSMAPRIWTIVPGENVNALDARDDTDAPEDLTYQVVAAPASGTVDVADGSRGMNVHYTTDAGFVGGADGFVLQVSDSRGLSVTTEFIVWLEPSVALDQASLHFRPGWNFFSLPFLPDADSLAALLSAGGGQLWDWVEGSGVFKATRAVQAFQGYCLFIEGEGLTVVLDRDGVRSADAPPALSTGWNLLGRSSALGGDTSLVTQPKFWSGGCFWDAAYAPENLPPIKGFWMLVR